MKNFLPGFADHTRLAPVGDREDYRRRDEWGRPANPSSWRDRISSILPISSLAVIIAICVIVFLFSLIVPRLVYNYLALYPDNLLQMPWTIITYMFVHAGFFHLFFNMWALFLFGGLLEQRVGERTFLAVFFASGIVAAFGQMLISSNPMVGASGAIFGVMGCLAIIAPDVRIIIFPFPIPISISVAIIIFALIDFLSFGSVDNIAHMAHITGLLVGLAFGYALKGKPRYGYI